MVSFQSIGLNARCILGDWSLGRSPVRVSYSNVRILRSASYVKVAELRGAHSKVVVGCVLSTSPTPFSHRWSPPNDDSRLEAQVVTLSCLNDLTSHWRSQWLRSACRCRTELLVACF